MWCLRLGGVGFWFISLIETYISNLSLTLSLEPSKKFVVGGGCWVVAVVESDFSVKLWPKPSWTITVDYATKDTLEEIEKDELIVSLNGVKATFHSIVWGKSVATVCNFYRWSCRGYYCQKWWNKWSYSYALGHVIVLIFWSSKCPWYQLLQ